jgi:rfaE bifunctional protein nucleotidyltransferase chain/domain
MDSISILRNKIFNLDSLIIKVNVWRFQNHRIVFTNGCFDILHQGHIDYLARAADLGTKLVLGLNTDASIKRLNKAPSRPIQDQVSRSVILASLFFVDAVVLFDEDTPLNLIESLNPDVLVKGADYTIDGIVGADFVLSKGGQVKTINYLPGYSTTAIEQRIKNVK